RIARRHALLLSQINPRYISDDETDYETRGGPSRPVHRAIFIIKEAAWMSVSLRNLLRSIDQEHEAHRGRGRMRKRIPPAPGESKRDNGAPQYLPRPCYDEDWLKNLTKDQQDRLQIKDLIYDFTLYDPSELAISGECCPKSTPIFPSAS
ncbi:uncharacterized protein BXZ73DRAFT_55269, partial [Epithele typhae]|uniref:uncharacterized protein n=1 Tax=Epithele typhae TaxID=378194 RepID=UPI0020073A40